jgi:ABC-2 type transport system ATP-binding protein
MMKRGEIVDDAPPERLLARYGRENLEDVFLDIARGRRQAQDAAKDNASESASGATS